MPTFLGSFLRALSLPPLGHERALIYPSKTAHPSPSQESSVASTPPSPRSPVPPAVLLQMTGQGGPRVSSDHMWNCGMQFEKP